MSTLPAAPSDPIAPRYPHRGPRTAAPPWYGRAVLVNVMAQILIVVTGGVVRVTGSGLGCPTWPQCVPGSFTPVVRQAQGYHKYIEFGNRSLTTVVTLTAIAALAATVLQARRAAAAGPVSRRLIALGAAPLLLVLGQAVVGGVTVLVGLSPLAVATHFLVSMVLIAVSVLLLLALDGDRPPVDRRELRWITAGVTLLAAVILALGTVVTGSGPHSGDAVTPARFGFNPRDVAWLHADAVWLFVGLVLALGLTVRLTGADAVLQRRVGWLIAVTVAQGVIGYVQYFTHLPVALVVLHMLGASLLVVAVTAVVAGVTGTGWVGAGGRCRVGATCQTPSTCRCTNGSTATATNNSVR